MKVIFLDFDGVLNSEGSFLYENNRRKRYKEQGVKGPVMETLCNVCTANFQKILDQYPDVKIVISSTWRTFFDLDWLRAKLSSYHIEGDRVIDKTPDFGSFGYRGKEIQRWLDDHPEVTHYIVIDDNDDMISAWHGKDRFVETTWEGGMTYSHAEEAIDKLSNFNKERVKERLDKEKKEDENT